MLGGITRAIFIINSQAMILYRYGEPTILTKRKGNELVGVLGQLRSNKLI